MVRECTGIVRKPDGLARRSERCPDHGAVEGNRAARVARQHLQARVEGEEPPEGAVKEDGACPRLAGVGLQVRPAHRGGKQRVAREQPAIGHPVGRALERVTRGVEGAQVGVAEGDLRPIA